MNNLPIELFEKIFRQLHQNDKVECLTVCREWKNALEKSCLFSTVRLQNTGQFSKLVNKIVQEPYQRNKVERLLIEMKHTTRSEIDLLPFLFPNIREVTFCEQMLKVDLTCTKILSPHIWSRSIQYISEKASPIFTYNILKGGVCPFLTEISIGGSCYSIKNELLQLMRYAPALKVLAVRNCHWSVMDLEVLHKKVPLLHSLSLDYDGPIPFPSSNYPTDIEPASSIMTLSVGSHISLTTESCLVLLDYLNSKYPNVTTFGHSILYGIGDGSNQCMTRGFIPYIRNISPHLVSLTVPSLAQFYHLTPVLEENNCLLEEFVCVGPINSTEITQITESSQAHTIQKLSIGMNHGWNRAFMNHLSNLTALTELSIFGRNEPPVSVSKRIHISDMLEAVGRSLITLKIAYISICLDNSSTPSYPNLKTLKLVSSHTPKNLDFFISKAFPNLNTLVIDRCDWTTSSFYFCGLKLSHLEVRHCLPSSSSHVLIATLCNNEKRWYTANNVSKWISQPNGLLSDSPAMHSLAFDQYDGFPFATFICDSLYSFFMVNVLI